MKFLHIADVHLGCTRYQLPESPRDFFEAWMDVLNRYAIGEKVDFVLICGDFFHKRAVPPETMDYAYEGLSLLKEAGIPVVAIEGNHDQKHVDTPFSWLRSLEKWGLIHLLEPESIEGELVYEEWRYDREGHIRGGYIDIGRARIFGSAWYGAQTGLVIPKLIDAIKENRRDGAFNILMLHTDVEGHQTHPIPALPIAELKRLREVVEYVALGHTHMHYEIDNWAFNPGSIEVTNIAEFRENRGVFIVEVESDLSFNARHYNAYHHRPFRRYDLDVSPFSRPEEITDAVVKLVASECGTLDDSLPLPIIEIKLTGLLGFPNSQIEQKKIRHQVSSLTRAFHVRLKNHSVPADGSVASLQSETMGREQIESKVIHDLVRKDKRFNSDPTAVSGAVLGAKRMALTDDEPEKIAEFIAAKIISVPKRPAASS